MGKSNSEAYWSISKSAQWGPPSPPVSGRLLLWEAPEQAVALHLEQGQVQQTLHHTGWAPQCSAHLTYVVRRLLAPITPTLRSQVVRVGSRHRGARHIPTQACAPHTAHGQEDGKMGPPCPHLTAFLTNFTYVISGCVKIAWRHSSVYIL